MKKKTKTTINTNKQKCTFPRFLIGSILPIRFCFRLQQSGLHQTDKRNVSDGVVSSSGIETLFSLDHKALPSFCLRLRLSRKPAFICPSFSAEITSLCRRVTGERSVKEKTNFHWNTQRPAGAYAERRSPFGCVAWRDSANNTTLAHTITRLFCFLCFFSFFMGGTPDDLYSLTRSRFCLFQQQFSAWRDKNEQTTVFGTRKPRVLAIKIQTFTTKQKRKKRFLDVSDVQLQAVSLFYIFVSDKTACMQDLCRHFI